MGKITVDALSSGRQSIDTTTPRIKGNRAIDAPSMKGKSTNLPKEGKKQEKPQSQPTLALVNSGIRQRVDTWIKRTRFWCNKSFGYSIV